MFYCVFTVDGDNREYFDINLPREARLPQEGSFSELVRQEIAVAVQLLDGKFVHFVHTSPLARDFFLREPFLNLWQQVTRHGGGIGLHCHEDVPGREYYFKNTERMREVITKQVKTLRGQGVDVRAYRGGYMAFTPQLIPVLEDNGIHLDFSCEPGRFLVDNGAVVSDWRLAPASIYRMSYDDHCKPGSSRVWEVPVGVSGDKHFYFERVDKYAVRKIASGLKRKADAEKRDIVVSVLTHSWDFSTSAQIESLKEKICVLGEYARFVNLTDIKRIIGEGS